MERLAVLRRPASPAYLVRTVGSPDVLLDRLQEAGVAAHLEPNGAVRLDRADAGTAQQVWEWAGRLGLGIRSMVPTQNSLEKIFIEAVREEQDAGA
jgi:hypothetical protein